MKLFETIISILEEKGPLSIPSICREVNQLMTSAHDILPSQIQSIVTRKQDLFLDKEGSISIKPDKRPLYLAAALEVEDRVTYHININFANKSFTFFEWKNNKQAVTLGNEHKCWTPGDIEIFKREIIALKIWKWQTTYGNGEGITLGKINWSVKVKTMCKTYTSEGTDSYPENWNKFCKSLEKLTGTVILF